MPFSLLASLTLGLAPFTPEPHLIQKIKWILDGSKTLALIDWFDLLMHGVPWLLLLFGLIAKLKIKRNRLIET